MMAHSKIYDHYMYTQIMNTKIFSFFEKMIIVNSTATENISAIKEARKLFDGVRSNLSNNEKKVIRRKLHKKEATSHFFKERENDGTLTDRHKNIFKNIARYSKNISKHLKNLSKHKKNQKNMVII